MTVDEMTERWVHKDDVQILRDIYRNEMTVSEFIEDKECYVYDLEMRLENMQELIYELSMETDDVKRLMRDAPLLLQDIKKD